MGQCQKHVFPYQRFKQCWASGWQRLAAVRRRKQGSKLQASTFFPALFSMASHNTKRTSCSSVCFSLFVFQEALEAPHNEQSRFFRCWVLKNKDGPLSKQMSPSFLKVWNSSWATLASYLLVEEIKLLACSFWKVPSTATMYTSMCSEWVLLSSCLFAIHILLGIQRVTQASIFNKTHLYLQLSNS